MKRKIIISQLTMLLIIGFQSFAQEIKDNSTAKNEVKIDVFDFIVLNAFEISYERLNTNKSSYGMSLFMNSSEETGYQEKLAITPFYRFYFLNKEEYGAKGFFVEVFTKYAFGKHLEYEYNYDAETKYAHLNLGFSVGEKWVHSSGIALEYSIGIGRSLGSSKNSPDLTVRGGVSLGYRF